MSEDWRSFILLWLLPQHAHRIGSLSTGLRGLGSGFSFGLVFQSDRHFHWLLASLDRQLDVFAILTKQLPQRE